METGGKSPRTCLVESLTDRRVKRQALASAAGISEGQFSKAVSGNGGSYDIDMLEHLPLDVLVDFLDRYGAERGFRVHAMKASELDSAVVEALHGLLRVCRLQQVVSGGGAVKADLRQHAEQLRRIG